MEETNRLTECSDFPELVFVERAATPESALKLGIQLHLAGLSLSDTAFVLWVGCRTLSPHCSQLSSEGKSTACKGS